MAASSRVPASRRPCRRCSAPVAVEGALVVLGGADLERGAAVAQREQARLLAVQELLDHERQLRPRRRRQRLLDRGRDHHPLAGGEPVRLDHDRRACAADIGARRPPRRPEGRGRRAVGMPCRAQNALVNAFEPSSRAAAALGPNALIPAARSRSTIPSTRGNSGPTTTRSIPPFMGQGDDAHQVVHQQPALGGPRPPPGPRRGGDAARLVRQPEPSTARARGRRSR